MSYLAFELDALKLIPDAALAAGISEERLAYGLLRMWSYCWTAKRDRVSKTHLLGFFGGDPDHVSMALGAFEFLEPDQDGGRVKGADRYLRIQESRSKGGKKAAGNLVPGAFHKKAEPNNLIGCPSATAEAQPNNPIGSPSAFHRAPSTELLKDPPPTPSAKTVALPARTAAEAEAELLGDGAGAFPPTPFGFYGWTQYERRERGLPHEGDPPRDIHEKHDRAIAAVGMDGLMRAYVRFLDDKHFEPRGWPIRVFLSDAVYRPRAADPPRRFRL